MPVVATTEAIQHVNSMRLERHLRTSRDPTLRLIDVTAMPTRARETAASLPGPRQRRPACACRLYAVKLMNDISFEDLAGRLTPEALALFREMAAAHIESTGDRMFISADTMGGTHMIFTGEGSHRQFSGFDGGAVEDLVDWRLLRVSYSSMGTANYRVTGEAQQFYGWLMQSEGSAVEQVEEEVHRVISGLEYASRHQGAAHHLSEAFELLWGGRTDDQVVSEIGDHLRKALMDATTDAVGPTSAGGQERPIQRLQSHIAGLDLPSREADVVSQIVELARVALRLDHRLNHIRDEVDSGEPGTSWDEIRRASFATAFVCYELDRL